MSWFGKKIDKIREQKKAIFCAWMIAKFLFGLGLGMLLASYFINHNWIKAGWFVVALGIVFSLPVIKNLTKK